MPHPTDETENTLPDPELNPLLNPVLGAHMGRWAEVYFTAPPEKREEAVSELLRELRKDSPSESPAAASDHGIDDSKVHAIKDANDHGINDHGIDDAKNKENSESPALEEAPMASPAAAPELALTCDLCAYQNGPGQLFCGMCGARLQAQPAIVIPQVAEANPTSTADWSEPEPAFNSHQEYANEPELGSAAAGVEHDATEQIPIKPAATKHVAIEPSSTESVWTLPHRSLPSFAMEPVPESAPYRYRVYIGAVLGILLVLLLYMAWRGTQAISGTAGTQSSASRVIPVAPPAAVPPPEAQPAAPAAVPSASPTPPAQPDASAKASPEDARPQPGAAETASPKATRPASRVRSEKPRASTSTARKSQPAATRHKSVVTMAASSSPMAADTGGAEELSSAEKYLNGTPRNSTEAAQWLWKAVGKGNLGATIALSDLYLRGDGVPKSCDQARLLLDAAARKGGGAAAERLRNLQAFGCN